jgi:ATP-dependent exoDNAse (exonuclease V) alpha subunit
LNANAVNRNSAELQAAIERARAAVRAKAQLPEKTFGQITVEAAERARITNGKLVWNTKQSEAIDLGRSGKSFCLIGAAGTGKTTTLRGLIELVLSDNKLPPLERSTKHLKQGSPGVVLFSYTRRAVRNIAKQMPEDIASHCITGHKLLEFKPEKFEIDDGKGGTRVSMRFVPSRDRSNPLPSNLRLIIVDESSMVSSDFMQLVYRALPNLSNVQWIFLGDLHQLPPVYGDAILGHKLLELPTVELTEVYRQALESPIIELALNVKDNKIPPELKACTKPWVKETPRGKVTLHPWKTKLDQEEGMFAMQRFLRTWIKDGNRPNHPAGAKDDPLDFENDVILCPWNKAFGNVELNKAIGTELALKYNRDVYEIIAGFQKIYYAVGDRILHDKRDAIVTRIVRNTRYVGKPPQYHSTSMDYWGYSAIPATVEVLTAEQIEDNIAGFAEMTVEDRVTEASHAVYLKYAGEGDDEEETILSKAGELNATELAYCMSVHKSQGSEWKRVIFITHDCHAKMLSREMVYTAFTRAKDELYVFMAPMMITKAAARPRIKGDTLKEKLKFFQEKAKEQKTLINDEDEDDE